jgi:leucyl-tRNA synthetase
MLPLLAVLRISPLDLLDTRNPDALTKRMKITYEWESNEQVPSLKGWATQSAVEAYRQLQRQRRLVAELEQKLKEEEKETRMFELEFLAAVQRECDLDRAMENECQVLYGQREK